MNYYLIVIKGAQGGASYKEMKGPFDSPGEAEDEKKGLDIGLGDTVLLLAVEGAITSCEEF